MKFTGTETEFKEKIDTLGLKGTWSGDEKKLTFRTAITTVIINWWPKTGTVQLQGKDVDRFKDKIEACLSGEDLIETKIKGKVTIFIVHGHDKEARDQLELLLRRLNLNPFILQDNDGEGKTLIEALENHIFEGTAFGIVLLTPDEIGYKKNCEEDKQHRARQNTIFEMGMLMASLGRERIAILKKGNLEVPSDSEGIIRLEFNENVVEIGQKLIGRLQNAGIKIDQKLIPNALAG